jgi:membrane-associated phospholipid phosphatase
VFRRVNTVPTPVWWVTWPFLQVGNLLAPVVVAVVAARVWRSRRPALAVLVSAYGAWGLAHLIRAEAIRARPAALLADVLTHEDARGPGFVSGHAAIATGTAVALWPYLDRRGRVVSVVAVVLVDLGRMMAGAHLPLDVIGGSCLGLITGLTVTAVLARPRP